MGRPRGDREPTSPRPEGSADRRALAAALLLAAAAAAVFLSSLGNGFTFDDTDLVAKNRFVTEPGHLRTLLTSHYWAANDARGDLWRPLTLFTYWIQHRAAGSGPWSFHLVNVALHAAVTALACLLCLRLAGSLAAASAAGLLFAVHPVHTEAVANVVGRAELMAALFVLAGWLWRDRRWSPLLYLLGLLSKESAIVLPGLMLVEDLLAKGAGGNRNRIRWRAYVPFAAVAAVWLAARALVVGPGVGSEHAPFNGVPAPFRIMTAVLVLGRYLGLMADPRRLSADYSFDQIPTVTSAADGGFLIGAAACGALLAAAWALRRRLPAAAAGVAAFFVALLPASNLPFGVGVVMAERLLYLPSLGLCLAAGTLAAAGTAPAVRPGRRLAAACILAGLPSVWLSGLTWRRSMDWRDDFTLFQTTVITSPRSAMAHANLGAAYQKLGRMQEAEEAYRRSLQIDPHRAGAQYSLATLLEATGRPDEAIRYYQEAVRLRPDDREALNNLGRTLLARGRAAEAVETLERAVALAPDAPTPRVNLAAALLHQGEVERAGRLLGEILASHPGDASAVRILEAVRKRREAPAGGQGSTRLPAP
ncbi:MAG TPA: tetratricopeptide repeat protein [Candidatus Polarisedimenticolia bacterium]|nr:tetratricopeptide repeat protein [Candidatus Polarisedimenticolia bacterium]